MKNNTCIQDYKQNDHLMFVYGSLKRGFHNHSLLRDEEFLGYGNTNDSCFLLTHEYAGFPCASLYKPDIYPKLKPAKIQGEVYKISGISLYWVDVLEGNGAFFNRKIFNVNGYGKCWIYILDGLDLPGNHYKNTKLSLEFQTPTVYFNEDINNYEWRFSTDLK
jgi:gamma-glutamylaminecyclotransferase